MRIAIHDYAGHPFVFELSRELARRGHEVGHFYFAEDIGPKGPSETTPDDPPTFSIHPLSIKAAYSKSNFLQRRRGDILYGEAAASAIKLFRPQVVISGNTPLEAQTHLVRAARDVGAQFVFWMQDFYSLAIERILGGRWAGLGQQVSNFYKRMEARLLRASQAVVLISEDFKPQLKTFGVPADRVAVIPNWGALDSIPQAPKTNTWAAAHGLSDKFVFLYSGTLALKHNPDLLWALAEAFGEKEGVRVVLAASGVCVDELKARHLAHPLANLLFLPLQPIEDFPQLLGSADVVVALLEDDAGEFSVPSKVLSYLCSGRPVLLSAPLGNLAARIVEQAGAGSCVPAGDAEAFIAAARGLYEDGALRRSQGAAGRAYAEATFDIVKVADRFEEVFSGAENPP